MKYTTTLLFLIFILNPIFGQKQLDIPENHTIEGFIKHLPKKLEGLNLKDLRVSNNSLNIRVWQTNNVFTLTYSDSASLNYILYIKPEENMFKSFHFTDSISKNTIDSLLALGIENLKDEKHKGIDGSTVFIEISTKDKYKIVSYWSPNPERSDNCKTVVQSIDIINRTVKHQERLYEFWNYLPAGYYPWSTMSNIHIDRFLNKETKKTDFYALAEQKIKTEFNITEQTNNWEYPLILINDQKATIADLNKYTKQNVSEFKTFKPDNSITAIYGTLSTYGLVIVKTK